MLTLLRFGLIAALIVGVGLWITRPQRVNTDFTAGLTADADRGAQVFHAGGCASCHVDPAAEPSDPPVLAGGYRIESPFGTFIAPNISPSEAGLAGWSAEDLANALVKGVSPKGAHYYPAFPYASYARMTVADAADLWAYIQTLPPSATPSEPSEVGFPFNIRRGLGLWKRLHVRTGSIREIGEADPALARGRYLVEGPGHCGECHTPRDVTGGMILSQWLRGAPNPDGRGRIPALAGPDAKIADWSDLDLAEYLRSGFTPDYDSAGGTMVDVIENTAKLSDEDRMAIGAYLKAL